MSKTPLAIAYDFDGTLAPGYMQEHSFIPQLGIPPGQFWTETNAIKVRDNASPVLAYLGHMLHRAAQAGVPVRREDFVTHGRGLRLFPGLPGWFGRVTAYGAGLGLDVRHYVISSGLTEMIEGTEIGTAVDDIFASGFKYDEDGNAVWPSRAVDYTTKTQYLFRLNKGCHAAHDEVEINRFVPFEDRPVPFGNIVFVGDGDTDVPCMSMLTRAGGHAIAVHDPDRSDETARRLVEEKRAEFKAAADYRDGGDLYRIVKRIMHRVAARNGCPDFPQAPGGRVRALGSLRSRSAGPQRPSSALPGNRAQRKSPQGEMA